MASLGDLIVRVGANIADFEASMSTVSARLDTIASEVDRKFSGFTAMGQNLAAAGAGLTAALTLPIAGLGTAAIQAAGAMEQAKVGFTTLLGSGQAATKMLTDLQKFAVSTPFNFPELATAAQRLLAMGTNAKDIIPTMTSIGNAVSAMGKGMPEFDRIALAFSQMSNSGKLSAADMRQFTEAGVGAWKYLAKETGISMTEIQEKAKNVLTGSQAAQIILKGMQQDFGGGMEAQSKTLLGMWSNVQDAIKFTLADIGSTLLPLGKTVIDDVITPLLTGLKDLAHWFAQLPTPVQNGAIALAAMLAAAGPIALAIGGISIAIGMLAPAITGIAAFIGISTAAFLGWAAAIPLAVAALVALGTWVSSNWASIKAVVAQAWDGITDIWVAAWTGIQSAISSVWSGFLSVATAAWGAVTGFLGYIWDGIGSLWTAAWSTITSGLSTAWSGVEGLASSAWSATTNYFTTLWDGLGPTWSTAWATITGALSTAWGGVSQAASTAWDAVTGFFSTVWDSVSTAFSTAWDGITGILTTAWGTVSSAVATVWNPIASFFGTIWDGISSAWGAVWNGISGVLSSIWNGIRGAAETAWGAVSSAISTFLQWAAKIPGVNKLFNLDDAWNSAKKLTEHTDKATAAIKTNTTEVGKGTTAHTAHATAVGKTAKAYDDGEKAVRKFTSAETTHLQKLADLHRKQDDANKDIDKWNQDIRDGVGPLNDLAHALDGFKVKVDDITPGIQNMNRVLAEANTSAADAKRAADDLAGAFGTLRSKSETDLKGAYDAAKTNFDLISGSGIATQQQIDEAFRNMLQAERDYKAGLGEDTSDLDAKLDGMTQAHRDHESDVKGIWNDIGNDIKSAVSTFSDSVGDAIGNMLHGDFSWDSLKSAVKGLKDDIVDAFSKDISKAISDFVSGALSDLLGSKGFGGLKSIISDCWGGIKNIFSVGGGAAGGVGGVLGQVPDGVSALGGLGGVAGGAGEAAGGASSALGGVLSSVTGVVGAAGAVVGAVSGVIGNFQMAGMNKSLDLLVQFGLKTTNYLGERKDGGILGVLFHIDEHIQAGYLVKAVEDFRNKFWDTLPFFWERLDAIVRNTAGGQVAAPAPSAAAAEAAPVTSGGDSLPVLEKLLVSVESHGGAITTGLSKISDALTEFVKMFTTSAKAGEDAPSRPTESTATPTWVSGVVTAITSTGANIVKAIDGLAWGGASSPMNTGIGSTPVASQANGIPMGSAIDWRQFGSLQAPPPAPPSADQADPKSSRQMQDTLNAILKTLNDGLGAVANVALGIRTDAAEYFKTMSGAVVRVVDAVSKALTPLTAINSAIMQLGGEISAVGKALSPLALVNGSIASLKDEFGALLGAANDTLREVVTEIKALPHIPAAQAPALAGVGGGGGGGDTVVNVNNPTILDSRTTDALARRVVDTLRRGSGRI